ncbi:MAG TPA: hypothetical protein VK507_23315 [Iamia sp.]|nr:hypothetical protein [Iamia sp.]
MTAPSDTSAVFVPLLLIPLAMGATWVALRLPRWIDAQRARRAAERTRSLRELLSLLPLDQAVQRELRRGRALLDPLTERVERRVDARDRAERAYTRHGQAVIESPDHVIAWVAVFGALSVLWLVLVTQHWLLEAQIINTLTSDPGSDQVKASTLAFSLATVAVAVTVGLGLLLAERIRPSGAIPGWKDKSLPDRAILAVGISVLLACVVVLYATIAPVRADDIHGPTVDSTAARCSAAGADLAAAPADSLDRPELEVAEQTACAAAQRSTDRHQAARTWDASITVLASLGEAVFGGFALHFAMLVGAGLLRVRVRAADGRIRRAQSKLRRRSVRFQDRVVDVVTAHPDVDPDEADAYIARFLDTEEEDEGGTGPEAAPEPADPERDEVEPAPLIDLHRREEDPRADGFIPLGDLAADRGDGPDGPDPLDDDPEGADDGRLGPRRPNDLPDAV